MINTAIFHRRFRNKGEPGLILFYYIDILLLTGEDITQPMDTNKPAMFENARLEWGHDQERKPYETTHLFIAALQNGNGVIRK